MRKKNLQTKKGFEEKIAVFQSENVIAMYPTTYNTIYLQMSDSGKITVKEMMSMLYYTKAEYQNIQEDEVLIADQKTKLAKGQIKIDDITYVISFTELPIVAAPKEDVSEVIISRDLVVTDQITLKGGSIVTGKVIVEKDAVFSIAQSSFVTVQDIDVYGTVEVYGTMTKDQSEEMEQSGNNENRVSPSFFYVTGTCNLLTDDASISQYGLTVMTNVNIYANVSYSGWYIIDCMYVEKDKKICFDNAWGQIQELHMRKGSIMETIDSEPVVMTCTHNISKGFQDQNGMGTMYTDEDVILQGGEGNHVSFYLLGNIIGPMPTMLGNICVLDSNGFIGNTDDIENINLCDFVKEEDSEEPIRCSLKVKEVNPEYEYKMNKKMVFTAALRNYLDEVLPDHGDLKTFDDVWYGCGEWDGSVDWHYKREEPFKKNSKYIISIN